MLHSYSFSNFQSFAGLVEVDFTSGKATLPTDFVVKQPGELYVSKVMMSVGSNASGKTSLIKPLAFISWFIEESFSAASNPILGFSPHMSMQDKPTTFTFMRDGGDDFWRYSATMNNRRVISETLERRDNATKRFGYVFKRELQSDTGKYTVKQKEEYFKFTQQVIDLLPKNVSFLSWAKQYGNLLATQLLNEWQTATNMTSIGMRKISLETLVYCAEQLHKNPEQLEQLSGLLNSWDLGLSSIKVGEFVNDSGDTIRLPVGVHRPSNSVEEEFTLLFTSESHGTQSALFALAVVLPALQNGSLVVFDELEANLHPHMIAPILKLFSSKETNPKNAQIIFTSHSLETMNLLQKSQIMLVEKNDCSSDAWRLDDISGVRTDDNFYAKYMAGAYAAIPNIE
jgi:AAA15 family ATPase/GTPase